MRAAILVCAVCACAKQPMPANSWVSEPDYYSVGSDGARSPRYSRIDDYTAYGSGGLGAQARIGDAYASAQHAPPPAIDPILFREELPPGIAVDGATLKVDPRSPYEPIGQFAISYALAAAPAEPDVVDDLERLAAVTRGDAIVLRLVHVADADPRVREMTGLVLRRRAPAEVAAPPPTHRRAKLAYSASPGCPTSDELGRAIAARLGYSPWDASATTELRAQITRAPRGFEASLQIGAATRRLSAASCRGLGDALVAIAVIELEGSG
ncbi:MAG TPA: hypothetical protein VGG74_11230 [Kofleriaceae bacterium]|jgi:hypothetical protein